MLRYALIAIVLVVAAPAQAACVSWPDSAATGYVANSTALALCRESELALRTQAMANEARIAAELGAIEAELARQRVMIMQQQTLPSPPVF